jgi:kanamycin nucleotidyltransferase
MTITSRLELAGTVTAQLRRLEGRNLLAVGLYGSVARGEDRAHSDIDLVLVVRSGKTGLRMLMRNGVLVSLLRLTPDEAVEEVRGYAWNLPEALSGWQSVRPLYDPTGLLRRLRDRSLRPTAHQFRETARRGFLGTFEDYGKLLNALEAGDTEEAREMAIWFTQGAAMISLCMERRTVSTGRRVFAELPDQRGSGNAIRRLRYETLSIEETTRLARSVWASLLRRARAQQIVLPEMP